MEESDLALQQSFSNIRGTSTAHLYVSVLRFPSSTSMIEMAPLFSLYNLR